MFWFPGGTGRHGLTGALYSPLEAALVAPPPKAAVHFIQMCLLCLEEHRLHGDLRPDSSPLAPQQDTAGRHAHELGSSSISPPSGPQAPPAQKLWAPSQAGRLELNCSTATVIRLVERLEQ